MRIVLKSEQSKDESVVIVHEDLQTLDELLAMFKQFAQASGFVLGIYDEVQILDTSSMYEESEETKEEEHESPEELANKILGRNQRGWLYSYEEEAESENKYT